MRSRNQRGASLILVLALTAFLALLLPAILGLVATGSKLTVPVIENRREVYAASSALDAAIQLGRRNPDIGMPGGECPSQDITIDGFYVNVSAACPQRTGTQADWCHADRFVAYTAEVKDGLTGPTLTMATAEVAFRFDPRRSWRVEVRRWNPSASTPTTAASLPSCPVTPPTVEDPPTGSVISVAWVPPQSAEWLPPNNKCWRGVGTVKAKDDKGDPVESAVVTFQEEYRIGTSWVPVAGSTDVATIADGSATPHSRQYQGPNGCGNQPAADAVRLTITGVRATGFSWTPPATPLRTEIERP